MAEQLLIKGLLHSLSRFAFTLMIVAPIRLCILVAAANAQLWMPFANLGTVIQTLKKHESFSPTFPEFTQPAVMNPFEYMSLAARPWIRNITRAFLGNDLEEGEEQSTTRSSVIPTQPKLDRRPTTLPHWIRNMTSTSGFGSTASVHAPTKATPSVSGETRNSESTSAITGRPNTWGTSSTPSTSTSTRALPPLMLTTNGISVRPPIILPKNLKNKFAPKKPKDKLRSTTYAPLPSSCELCKPGRPCSLRLRSFETSDQIFQYAYSHATMLEESLLSVLRETQGTILPPPLAWKASVSPETVQLAQTLMRIQRPNRSLVVGVFSGLSLLAVAALTDSRGIVIALEYPEFAAYWEKIGMQHAIKLQLMNRIQMRSQEDVDRAIQRIATTEPNTFDFIILDDYRQVNYLDDYEHAVRLLRNGGVLLITDAFNGGAVLSGPDYVTQEGKAVQNMNLRIKQDSRVVATLLPFSGGTWLITKI